MYPILCRDGANSHTIARFYLAVVQAKWLFGSERWVLTKRTLERLERFHARCAHCIAHRPVRRLSDGSWECPHPNEVLDCCGLGCEKAFSATKELTFHLPPRSDRRPDGLTLSTNFATCQR